MTFTFGQNAFAALCGKDFPLPHDGECTRERLKMLLAAWGHLRDGDASNLDLRPAFLEYAGVNTAIESQMRCEESLDRVLAFPENGRITPFDRRLAALLRPTYGADLDFTTVCLVVRELFRVAQMVEFDRRRVTSTQLDENGVCHITIKMAPSPDRRIDLSCGFPRTVFASESFAREWFMDIDNCTTVCRAIVNVCHVLGPGLAFDALSRRGVNFAVESVHMRMSPSWEDSAIAPIVLHTPGSPAGLRYPNPNGGHSVLVISSADGTTSCVVDPTRCQTPRGRLEFLPGAPRDCGIVA